MVDSANDDVFDHILKILTVEKIECIMQRDGAHDKEQLTHTVIELFKLIYHNTNIPELRDEYTEYINVKNSTISVLDFINAFFVKLIHILKKIQKPIEYYMDAENVEDILYKNDPLRLVKHLDAFINGDDGYGWGDIKLISKKELVDRIVLELMV